MTSLYFVLVTHGVELNFSDLGLAKWLLDVATDQKSEVEFAVWLRTRVIKS